MFSYVLPRNPIQIEASFKRRIDLSGEEVFAVLALQPRVGDVAAKAAALLPLVVVPGHEAGFVARIVLLAHLKRSFKGFKSLERLRSLGQKLDFGANGLS